MIACDFSVLRYYYYYVYVNFYPSARAGADRTAFRHVVAVLPKLYYYS